jgi:hypothetical protein
VSHSSAPAEENSAHLFIARRLHLLAGLDFGFDGRLCDAGDLGPKLMNFSQGFDAKKVLGAERLERRRMFRCADDGE